MYSSTACPCNGVIPWAPCPVLERGGTPLIIPGFHSTVCFREVDFKDVSSNGGVCSTIPFFRGVGGRCYCDLSGWGGHFYGG